MCLSLGSPKAMWNEGLHVSTSFWKERSRNSEEGDTGKEGIQFKGALSGWLSGDTWGFVLRKSCKD